MKDTINFVILAALKSQSSQKYPITMVLPLELLIIWLQNTIFFTKEGTQAHQQTFGPWG